MPAACGRKHLAGKKNFFAPPKKNGGKSPSSL
jgi:hypothetical protein